MPKVHFVNEMVTVDVPVGTSLREVAMAQGIQLYRGMWTNFNCFGNGICGRCRLWVLSATPTRPKFRERLHRSVRGSMRLACQVRVSEDIEVHSKPLGAATVKADSRLEAPSYRAQAEQRMREAREAEASAAREAAQKKAAAEKAAADMVASQPASSSSSEKSPG